MQNYKGVKLGQTRLGETMWRKRDTAKVSTMRPPPLPRLPWFHSESLTYPPRACPRTLRRKCRSERYESRERNKHGNLQVSVALKVLPRELKGHVGGHDPREKAHKENPDDPARKENRKSDCSTQLSFAVKFKTHIQIAPATLPSRLCRDLVRRKQSQQSNGTNTTCGACCC